MKKILVPIDFSDVSTILIDKAVELARQTQADIHLLHVASLDLSMIVGDARYSYLHEIEDVEIKDKTQKLEHHKKNIISKGVNCEFTVKQGPPIETILDEAENIKADLIAIGSLNHNALYKVFIGSVASGVIKNSSIPLLVIPMKKEKIKKE